MKTFIVTYDDTEYTVPAHSMRDAVHGLAQDIWKPEFGEAMELTVTEEGTGQTFDITVDVDFEPSFHVDLPIRRPPVPRDPEDAPEIGGEA